MKKTLTYILSFLTFNKRREAQKLHLFYQAELHTNASGKVRKFTSFIFSSFLSCFCFKLTLQLQRALLSSHHTTPVRLLARPQAIVTNYCFKFEVYYPSPSSIYVLVLQTELSFSLKSSNNTGNGLLNIAFLLFTLSFVYFSLTLTLSLVTERGKYGFGCRKKENVVY